MSKRVRNNRRPEVIARRRERGIYGKPALASTGKGPRKIGSFQRMNKVLAEAISEQARRGLGAKPKPSQKDKGPKAKPGRNIPPGARRNEGDAFVAHARKVTA